MFKVHLKEMYGTIDISAACTVTWPACPRQPAGRSCGGGEGGGGSFNQAACFLQHSSPSTRGTRRARHVGACARAGGPFTVQLSIDGEEHDSRAIGLPPKT